MSNKKNKIKIRKPNYKLRIAIRILIIILIILVFVFSIYLRVSDKPKAETVEPNWEGFEAHVEEYFKDKVIPQHIYDFYVEYKGEIEKKEIYEDLYIISEYLPDLCSDLKEVDEKTYYSKFADKIKNYIGIETESEFVKLSNFLKENDVSNLAFEYCSYHPNSIVKDDIYSNFQMDFCYENDTILTFNMGVVNEFVYKKPVLKIIP